MTKSKQNEAVVLRKNRAKKFARKAGATKLKGICDDAGQANKSARGMPWHQEPKKDVTSCDKPRGAAHER